MFHIPLNYSLSVFLLGAVFSSLFCILPSWLTWFLGVFLTILRWKTIYYFLGLVYDLLATPLTILTARDLDIIRFIRSHGVPYRGPATGKPSEPHAVFPELSLCQLLDLNLSERSSALFLGASSVEYALSLHQSLHCHVIILDKDALQVQRANDHISTLKLWANVKCLSIDSFRVLDYEDQTFDALFCMVPMLWLRNSATRAVIAEWRRVCRPHAHFHLTTLVVMNRPDWWRWTIVEYVFPRFAMTRRWCQYAASRQTLKELLSNLEGSVVVNQSADFVDSIKRLLQCLESSSSTYSHLADSALLPLLLKIQLLSALIRWNFIQILSSRTASVCAEYIDSD